MTQDKAREEWDRQHPETDRQRTCRMLCDSTNNGGYHMPECPIVKQAQHHEHSYECIDASGRCMLTGEV